MHMTAAAYSTRALIISPDSTAPPMFRTAMSLFLADWLGSEGIVVRAGGQDC